MALIRWSKPTGKRPDGGTKGYPRPLTRKERLHRKRRRQIARASRQRNRR